MRSVLIIEDDLDIQKVYFEKLETEGYKVYLAADSSQGFQIAKDECPDIILLDVMLPGKMNGIELLEKLKSSNDLRNIPVIVMTNLDTEKENALSLGANDYLVKSATDLNDLVAKIKKNAH